MNTQQITNEMLYELIKEFKGDVYRRFDEIDKHFEHMEEQQNEDHKILMQLWGNRNKQTLNFTSIYFLITFFSSVLAAIASSYIIASTI